MTQREDEYDYLFKGKCAKCRNLFIFIYFFRRSPTHPTPNGANHLCEQVSPDADM